MTTSAVAEATSSPAPEFAELSLLAAAIAGSPLALKIGAIDSESYCDGTAIAIAAGLSAAQSRDVVIAHALLIAAGSFAEVKFLRGRRRAAQIFFALELRRALTEFDAWLPRRCLAHIGQLAEISLSASAVQSRQQALAGMRVSALPEYLGSIKPFRVRMPDTEYKDPAQALRPGATTGMQLDTADDDDELDDTAAKFLKLFSTPLRGSRFITEQLMQILGMKRTPGGKAEGDSDGEGIAVDAGGAGAWSNARATVVGIAAQQRAIERLRARSAFVYPEWDCFRQAYRNDWVQLSECDPRRIVGNSQSRNDSIDTLLLRDMLVALARVGVEFQTVKAQPMGDDLDLDALTDYAVELRVGHSPRENVYRCGQRTPRDLSALVLLDVSSSTRDRTAAGSTVFEQQRACARVLTRAFSTLGDRVAAMGFHSWGRHLARTLLLKRFDELAGADCASRFAALQPAGLTRPGAAIRHAAQVLARERFNTHRLLIVLSDGVAYDDEYEGRYAEADTERALMEARTAGIACVCISIGATSEERPLQRIFGAANYLRCDTAAAVPQHLRELCNRALNNPALGSDKRRRSARVKAL